MAWDTYIQGIERVGDAFSVNVVYVNETEGRKEARTVRASNASKESVFAALRAERDRLDLLDITKRDIPFDVPVDIDAGMVTPPVPNAEAVVFFNKLRQLRELNELATLGVLDWGQVELVALQTDLAKTYDPTFYGVAP